MGATSASAATVRSGGLAAAVEAAAAATPTAPPSGTVEIPAGMKTVNGTRATRYRGRNADHRRAYFARIPLQAPDDVQKAIIAANQIVGKPYKYGGGHGKVEDSGYDCSGTVSYALIGADLLKTPLSSYEFDDEWKLGVPGKGQWISVYGNRSHAWAVIAGLRLDTSAAYDKHGLKGPQWRPNNRKDAKKFTVMHPSILP